MASTHVCPCCMGMWMSMDLELGFPRIRSLCGAVCLFVNQGVYWFMWWSIIVTWSLDVKMGLARFTSLCPPRIRLLSLPRASPPSWFHIEVLSSAPVRLRSVFSTSECLFDCGFRSKWPVSQSGSRRCIFRLWVVYLRARMMVHRRIGIRVSRVSL